MKRLSRLILAPGLALCLVLEPVGRGVCAPGAGAFLRPTLPGRVVAVFGAQTLDVPGLSGLSPVAQSSLKARVEQSSGAYYAALREALASPGSSAQSVHAAALAVELLQNTVDGGVSRFIDTALLILEETPEVLSGMRVHWGDVFAGYLEKDYANFIRLLVDITNRLSPSSGTLHPQAQAMFTQLVSSTVGDGALAKKLTGQFLERVTRNGEQPFRMLVITPEYEDFMAAGGVATFIKGWVSALNQHWNAWATVFMPRYRTRVMKSGLRKDPVMLNHVVSWTFKFAEKLPDGREIVHEGRAYRAGLPASWAGQPPTYLIADMRGDEHCLTSDSYARGGDAAMKARQAAFIAAGSKALLQFISEETDEMQRPDLVVLNDWPTGLAGGMADEPGRIPTLSIIHNAFDYALGDVPLEAFETSSQVPEKHLPGFYFTEAHMEKGDVALSGRKEREIDDPASGKGKKKIITECLIGLGAALHASLVMGVSPTFVSMMLNSGNTFPGLRDILRIKDFFRSLFGVSHGLNPYEGSEPVETPEQRQRLMTARKDAKELLFEETGLMEQIHDRARDEMRASGRPTSGPEFDREIQSRLKAPTLAIVSRLDAYQKGFDLLMAPVRPEDPRSPSVLEALLDQGVRIVVHGPKGGSADFTAFLERLSHDARYRGQVAFLTGFDLSDEPMIRNVARAREITYDHPLLKLKDLVFQLDGFLLPSREEPFGMTMLEALRDGTPLIGSTNGGPLDILGALDARVHPHGIGFLFGHLWAHGDDPAYQALLPHLKDYTAQGFYETLQDWLAIYHQPERWEQLVVDAKNYRRTWKDATREFLEFVIPRIRPDLAGKLLKPIDRAPRALFAGA